ncbi:hypothetical protein YC2023_005290 [Brassica napus]
MHGAVGKDPSWVHPVLFRRGLNQRLVLFVWSFSEAAHDGSRTILSSGFIPICISKCCFSDVGVVSKGFLSRRGLVSCDGGGFLLWLKRGGGSLPPVRAQVSVYRVVVGFLSSSVLVRFRVSSGAVLCSAWKIAVGMEAFVPRFVFIAIRLVLRLVVQGLSRPFTVPPSPVLAVSEARMASYSEKETHRSVYLILLSGCNWKPNEHLSQMNI